MSKLFCVAVGEPLGQVGQRASAAVGSQHAALKQHESAQDRSPAKSSHHAREGQHHDAPGENGPNHSMQEFDSRQHWDCNR